MTFERLQDFQTLRVRSDHNLRLWLGFGHRLGIIGHIARGETCRWQVFPGWWLEFEQFTRWRYEGICYRIEGKLPRITHGGDDGRGSKEVHGLDISIVPGAEISVEGSEDSYKGVQYMAEWGCLSPTIFFTLPVLALPLDGA